MKTKLLFILVVFLMAGCFSTRDYIVDSDYSYKGKFKKYKTYMFIESNTQDPNLDLTVDATLRRMIKNRMGAQGYQLNTKKPDLLINYKLFVEDLEFLGCNQPSLEYWVKQSRYDEDGERIDYTEDSYNFETHELTEGALLITFFDRKKHFSVWQGYSSGFFTSEIKENDRYLRAAVNKIFDEYRLIAEGYEISVN